MGIINVDFNKFYKMSSECVNAASEYRKYIIQLKQCVDNLNSMSEPSLQIGISHLNELISDMTNSAVRLETIADKISKNLEVIRKTQNAIESAANKLSN